MPWEDFDVEEKASALAQCLLSLHNFDVELHELGDNLAFQFLRTYEILKSNSHSPPKLSSYGQAREMMELRSANDDESAEPYAIVLSLALLATEDVDLGGALIENARRVYEKYADWYVRHHPAEESEG